MGCICRVKLWDVTAMDKTLTTLDGEFEPNYNWRF
jgi:hypothetical protein